MTWWSSNGPRPAGDDSAAEWSWATLAARTPPPEDPAAPTAEESPDPGYDEGFREGVVEGEARATEALASAVAAAEKAARRLQEDRQHLTEGVEEDVLVLALAVARHIVGRELRGDADTFADRVREALNAFPLNQAVKIRVHPADLSRISSISEGGDVIPISGGRDVQWIADSAIVESGCVLEGPERVLDGRLDHTLERVFQALRHG
jgi:flagellar assembly protein FliH